jgi:hypothetical protein
MFSSTPSEKRQQSASPTDASSYYVTGPCETFGCGKFRDVRRWCLGALVLVVTFACESEEPSRSNAAGASSSGRGGSQNEGGGPSDTPGNGGRPGDQPCNGWPQLCERSYDTVSFPTSHAAMANESTLWEFPAQRHSLRRQLDDGMRALMLEVHEGEDGPLLCWDDCADGFGLVPVALGEIGDFLGANPNEVVTLFIDNRVGAPLLADAFDDAGLLESAYVLEPGVWPTLRELIDSGRRLVVFVEDAAGAPPELQPAASWVRRTRSDYRTPDDFECTLKPANNPLSLVQHVLVGPASDGAGGEGGQGGQGAAHPSESRARTVNRNPVLIERLRTCERLNGRAPNFVAVDFYDTSDLMLATQVLNGLVILEQD